jgi:hypothetical protein
MGNKKTYDQLAEIKKEAGQEVKRGRPSTRLKPEREALIKLYILESRSIRDIAETLVCKKDMVH